MRLFRKIFGGNSRLKPDGPLISERAMAIIQAFGGVLEGSAPTPGCVADSSKLPYTKERISEALLWGLGSNVAPQTKEMLKVAYLELANWQPGVGAMDQGLDLSKLDSSAAVEGQARAVLAQMSGSEKWQRIVDSEQAARRAELEARNLW